MYIIGRDGGENIPSLFIIIKNHKAERVAFYDNQMS